MTGNRYRRDVSEYTPSRWGFTITDNTTHVIVYQGTGYPSHAAADADCRHYIVQLAGQITFLTPAPATTVAAQSRLF